MMGHRPVIDVDLLGQLLHMEGPRPAEQLAADRRGSLSQLRAEIDRLRDAGCTFDEHPVRGLRLVEAGLGAWVDYLQSRHGASRLVEVYRRTASTQDAARRLIESRGEAADRALVLADEQTAGRGRLGRRWVAPAGTALTFTRVVLPESRPGESAAEGLTFAAAVAVARAVDVLLDSPGVAALKWPNDVCVAGRKMAGILVETFRPRAGPLAAMVGIGLNVALTEDHLPPRAGSGPDPPPVTGLVREGGPTDRLYAAEQVVACLDHALEQAEVETLCEQWRRRCGMLHQTVRGRDQGQRVEGQVVDLDPREGLIVRTSEGAIVHLHAATTTILP